MTHGLRGEPRDIIWLRSVSGSLLGIVSGIINMVLVQRFLPDLFGALLAVAVGGVIAGALQGGFMRRYTQPALLWLGLTAVGWLAAFIALGMTDWSLLLQDDFSWRNVSLCALMTSVPQWGMLRRHVGRAWFWVLINLGCWWLAGIFAAILLL